MTYEKRVTDEQIDNVLNNCADQEDEGGSKYPCLSYEKGVEDGIRFVLDTGLDAPDDEWPFAGEWPGKG